MKIRRVRSKMERSIARAEKKLERRRREPDE
jgi:hypothetical protein